MSTQRELTIDAPEAAKRLAPRRSTPDWRELIAIFLGGVAGAMLRVWLARQFPSSPSQWPSATFAANVSGAFILGWLVTRLQERLPLSTYRRPLLGTGFCGAYTTFSTMQIEALAMIKAGHALLAIAYALGSISAGYLAVWVATAIARRTRRL